MNNTTNKSFSDVFLENNALIYKYIFLRTGYQREVAEDLSQEVFYKALKNFDKYNKNKSGIRTWLFIIARNTIIDFYRQNNNKTIDIEKIENILVVDEDHRELTHFVMKKIAQMKQAEQDLILYKFIWELTDDEISKVIKKTNIATRVMLHRTINKLKQLIN